jgi:hypothetical protein
VNPGRSTCAVGVVVALTLVACASRTVSSTRGPASGASGITHHGYVDGELVLRFTPEGERAVAAVAGTAQRPLRMGIPSLDQLNAKYRASSVLPLEGERGSYRLRLAPDTNVLRAAEEYGRDPAVTRAEPNYVLRIQRPAEDPGAVRTDVSR